jgi:hypothetical protein
MRSVHQLKAVEDPGPHNAFWCGYCGKKQWWSHDSTEKKQRREIEQLKAQVERLRDMWRRQLEVSEALGRSRASYKGQATKLRRQLNAD